MTWVLTGIVAWLTIAMLLGVLIGRSIRMADARRCAADRVRVPDHVPDEMQDAFGPPTYSPGA
jgi:hypothetical protein